MKTEPEAPARGRPPLSAEEIAARIRAYCARHGVRPPDAGVPPFPTGRRETPQHREWLALYRAVRRLQARDARRAPGSPQAGDVPDTCGLCARPLGATSGVRASLDRSRHEVSLHESCAELLRVARAAGCEAVEAASRLLWPDRRA